MRRRSSLLAAALLTLAAGPAWAQRLGHGGVTSVFGPQGEQVLAVPSDAEVMAAAPQGRKPEGSAVMHCKAATVGGQPISSAVNIDFHFAAHTPGEPGKLP